jgi:hypothetical protein
MKAGILATLVALFVCTGTPSLHAQTAASDSTPLRVFVDCSYFCDMDYVRTEMPWVDYMRDRADAEVHILVSQQATGGGGSRFTLEFIGLKEFAALNDTLAYTAGPMASPDDVRRGLTQLMKVGLVPFLARTPYAERLQVDVAPPAADAPAEAVAVDDPWDNWRFSVGLNLNADGQSRASSHNLSGNIGANRTTEDWKISLGLRRSESQQTFTFPGDGGVDEEQKFVTRSSSFSGLVVRSLGSNFSAGLQGSAGASTFGNTDLELSVMPAIEYDVFPYSESNRRMLTARYAIGVRSFDYRDTTIYFQTRETHPQHSLNLSYSNQERWGSIGLQASYSEYLHDRSFNNAGLFGNASVRLFKGLSMNVFGDYSRVRDQLSLAKTEETTEEVLLHQRELRTSYSYFLGVGLSYSFGSIFNNIVNPRFGGGGGTTIIMM